MRATAWSVFTLTFAERWHNRQLNSKQTDITLTDSSI